MGLGENKIDQDGRGAWSFDFLNVNCCRRTAFAIDCPFGLFDSAAGTGGNHAAETFEIERYI